MIEGIYTQQYFSAMKIARSPISAICLGASVSLTPPIERTMLYSGVFLAKFLIWFKMIKREELIFFRTVTASWKSIFVDAK